MKKTVIKSKLQQKVYELFIKKYRKKTYVK